MDPCGLTLRDRKRNDDIRRILGIASITDKVREARLRWYGHVQRREEDDCVWRMHRIELNGEEPVWLTPYLRDPQPEGEREKSLDDVKPYKSTVWVKKTLRFSGIFSETVGMGIFNQFYTLLVRSCKSRLVWHNFVKVGDNWIKICNLV